MPNDFDDSFRYEPIKMPPPEEEEPPPPGWWNNRWLPIGLALFLFALAFAIVNWPKHEPETPPTIVIDLPALMGKRTEQVVAVLGDPTQRSAGDRETGTGDMRAGEFLDYTTDSCAIRVFIDGVTGQVNQITCVFPDRFDPGKAEVWLPDYGFTQVHRPGDETTLLQHVTARSWSNVNGCDLVLDIPPQPTTSTLTVTPAGM